MKKSLLFILFCCMGFVAKAQTIEEIKTFLFSILMCFWEILFSDSLSKWDHYQYPIRRNSNLHCDRH